MVMATLEEHILDLSGKMSADTGERNTNSNYYEAGHRPQAIGLAVPPAMRKLLAKIGWPRTYLDSLEERLDIEGFHMPDTGSDDKLWRWWQANNMDVQSGQAHLEALIHGRCYVSVAAPNVNHPLMAKNTPSIKVESPKHMYADIDPATGMVKRAIRRYTDELGRDEGTLYLPNATIGFREGQSGVETTFIVEHNLGIVPVVCILNKQRLDQTNGCSEIKPELRSATDAAARLIMNLQATAELMAVPQRAIFGLEADEIEKITGEKSWDAYIANILAFADSEGKITQLAAAELRNFADGMEILRKEAAAATGLPPQYFSFQSDNPASADAIRASEDRLVKKSERKQRIFGEAWEQVMRLCLLIMDGEVPDEAYRMETSWRNAATPTFAAQADAVTKLATAQTPDGRPVVPVEMARIKLGFSDGDQKAMKKMDSDSPRSRMADLYGRAAASPSFSDKPTGDDQR